LSILYYDGSGLNGQIIMQAGQDATYSDLTSTLLVDGGTVSAEKGLTTDYYGTCYLVVDNGGQFSSSENIALNGDSDTGFVDIIDGTVDVKAVINLSGSEKVRLGLDGVLKVKGNVDFTDLINDGYVAGAFGATGVTYAYDSGENKTIVQGVPEPATLCLLGIGALFLRRRKNA
jgi:hypothetical protein